jgi:Tol biopolymer transport system component
MKRSTRILGCGLLLVFAAAAQTPQQLFEQGLVKERSEGKLQEAIQLYQRAAAAAGKDRALAARALVEAGQCYQKLGNLESRKLFERVVKDYGDQKESVALARAGLRSDPAAPRTGVVVRQVWTGPGVDVYGTISPDGHYLSFVDWSTGDLAIRDLKTGDNRHLTNKPKGVREHAEWSAISKDGKQVAYSWFKGEAGPPDWRYQVRVASLSGEANPRVLFDSEEVQNISPYDWSPDGKWLAVGIKRKDHTAQIGLLSTAGGELRVLKTVDWRGSDRIHFSPDGKFLAYDLPASDAGLQRDIFVMATDGSREIAAVVDPNQDLVLGWSPDGRQLLFSSDRTGTMSLYTLPFADGRIAGPPKLVKTDIGNFETPMGVSSAGALYLGRTGVNHDIALATVDWPRGTLSAASITNLSRSAGSNFRPDWSPDGKELAYLSNASRGGVDRTLQILAVDTGQHRELQPRLSFFDSPRWSPDGRSFLVQGTDLKGRQGIFRVDAQSGEATTLVQTEVCGSAEWAPDGRKIYLTCRRDGQSALLERDLESGRERTLITRRNLGFTYVSPDGRSILTKTIDTGTRIQTAVLVPADGGEAKELMRGNPDQGVLLEGWTPDGKAVVIDKASGKTHEFWRVPADGGAPQKMDLDLHGIETGEPLRFDPTGRRIAMTAMGASKSEVSVIENFLGK